MISLKRTRIVAATPQEIFQTLSNPQELTNLIPRVKRVDILERHATHARLATHMAIGGVLGTIRCEGDLRWQEPHEIVFTVRKPLPLENRWTLTEVAEGTEISVAMALDLTPLLGPFAQFVPTDAVANMLSSDLENMLQRIAQLVGVGLRERTVAA